MKGELGAFRRGRRSPPPPTEQFERCEMCAEPIGEWASGTWSTSRAAV